jgi:rare lipoprotein A
MDFKNIIILIFALLLTACTTTPQDYAPSNNIDVSRIPNAKPKIEAKSKYGNPYTYTVYGKHYYVLPSSKNYHATGIASWYGMKFHHQLTSNHEIYDVYKMTAAHKTLPIPSYVKVTNLENGKQVIVRINDRGPFKKNRLIDLSYAAAKKLDIIAHGTGLVHVDAINLNNQNVATPQIYLQTGAFSHIDNAKHMQQQINNNVTKLCKIIPNTNNHLYLVKIGPIKNATVAHNITVKLASIGIHHLITTIK